MGMPATTDRYWTPADLEQFSERDGCKYECIDGELLVTPAPRFDHGRATQCLVVFRDPTSRQTKLDDMAGISMLVDVPSPSTAKRNRGIKRRLYHQAGIAEYWIDDATGARCAVDLLAFFAEVCGDDAEAKA